MMTMPPHRLAQADQEQAGVRAWLARLIDLAPTLPGSEEAQDGVVFLQLARAYPTHGDMTCIATELVRMVIQARSAAASAGTPSDVDGWADGDEVVVTITDVHIDGIGDHHTWLACKGVAEGIELPFVDDDGQLLPNVRIRKAGA